MDEERDIAKNLAEALREVKAMREGRLSEPTWEDFKKEMEFWIEETKENDKAKVAANS